MRTFIFGAVFASLIALAGCNQTSGNLTETGTGNTPSSGIVPAQTPE